MVVDVPFLAQTEDLCGGAAAAMVLRYWGVSDVQAEDFAPLVDHTRHGITTGALVQALTSRGFVARPIKAEPDDVANEIASGRPVIALIDGGSGRLHYVVVVAWASRRVLFHDPSLGPFRVRSEPDFVKRWKATNGFAIVLTPDANAPAQAPPPAAAVAPAATPRVASACDALVDPAIAVARGADPELAWPALTAASEMCPNEARPWSALSGVRFRQERWKEAAGLARHAVGLDPADSETWRLLGASLFLADLPREALSAWNHIDEPKIDRVEMAGLIRTRQEIAMAVLGLHPRDLLTEKTLADAERRLEQLPTAVNPKITYRPRSEGRADVVASVLELPAIERLRWLALRLGIEGVARRELQLPINSPTGRGERLDFGWRFASHRPAVWASLATPRLAGLPGVVSLSALWDRQTYRLGSDTAVADTVEVRRRGAIDWSHWTTASTRVDLGVGIDLFDGGRHYASVRGASELRLAKDRVAALTDATSWISLNHAPGFEEFGGTLAFRSRTRPARIAFNARVDGQRATTYAPFALWPGAGRGSGRPLLLRASRLVREGVLVGDAFGRGLLHATAEAEVAARDRGPIRLGVAAFVDWAKPWDAAFRAGAGPGIFAIGAGLRLRAFSNTALRLDLAKRPDQKGIVFSGGIIPPWPR